MEVSHVRQTLPQFSRVRAYNPLSANSKKYPIRKLHNTKALQKSKKLVTFSMTVAQVVSLLLPSPLQLFSVASA